MFSGSPDFTNQNDCSGVRVGLEEFKSQLITLIVSHIGKKYNGKSGVRLVLVSPIACEDLGKLTPERDRRNRELNAYTGVMRDVATDAEVLGL